MTIIIVPLFLFLFIRSIQTNNESGSATYRINLITLVPTLIFTYLIGRYQVKLKTDNLKFILSDDEIHRFLDTTNMNWFQKFLIENGQKYTDESDVKLKIDEITKIIDKKEDVILECSKTNFTGTRHLVAIPKEIENYQEIIEYINNKSRSIIRKE